MGHRTKENNRFCVVGCWESCHPKILAADEVRFSIKAKAEELPGELHTLFARFAQERNSGEHFGNWAARVLWR